MSGALSIPFAFLALFDIPGRLLFAALAYVSLLVLTVAQTRRISELQGPVPSADVTLRVGSNLIDGAEDPHWIRGEIENEGDRAAGGCRLKLLRVEGQNVVQARKIENGELQWQGGGCVQRDLISRNVWFSTSALEDALTIPLVRSIGGYKPPFPIPETQSAFHPRAQRTAFRRRRCASAIP
jgi:hypothetical protein